MYKRQVKERAVIAGGVSAERVRGAEHNAERLVAEYIFKPADRIAVVMPYPRRETELVPENIPLIFDRPATLFEYARGAMVFVSELSRVKERMRTFQWQLLLSFPVCCRG